MTIRRYALIAVLMVVRTYYEAHATTVDEWAPFTQPDGTTFVGHVFGDEIAVNWVTAAGYAFVYNPTDDYWYYAELDSNGEYRASAAKVGIDDPVTHGIPKHLQRSAAREAALQAARIDQGYVKIPAEEGATGQFGDPSHAPCTRDSPCDVYVVMVTFEDSRSNNVYGRNDQPWGYPMALFEQFFNGSYEGVPAYTGTIAHTSASHDTENLEVFGSLRAYFHQVHGEDILRFHILNECANSPCGETDEPVWIQLNATTHPNTKEWYAQHGPNRFWNAAEAAACANLTLPTDFPAANSCGTTPAASADILLTNKVLYLYAGFTATIENTGRALHPRVNHVTESTTVVGDIGARYVMGERQGHHNTERNADRFAGIGMHVHEIGHLFGFVHPDGGWDGRNPHTNQDVQSFPANLLGWGSMQSAENGPVINPNNWAIPHRSCPHPYNPFYRMDIGWNTRHDIPTTALERRIEPGPNHYYVVRGANVNPRTNVRDEQLYILDYRTNSNFGQYTYWHRFTSSPGLLIWRRGLDNTRNFPMVIPADGRSIVDARPTPLVANPRVPTWRDRLSDPFGAPAQTHGPTVTQATDASHLQHATVQRGDNNHSANPDPGPSRLIFRNISNEGTHALVDIIFIPFAPSTFAVTAGDGQAELNWTAPTPEHGGTPQYEHRHRSSADMGTTWTDWTAWTDVGNALTASVGDLTGGETYAFAVRAYSGVRTDTAGTAATHEVVIGHLGSVTLGSNSVLAVPTVGDVLTATLADGDDMISGQRWQWERTDDDADEGWTSIGTDMNSYELAEEDVGEQVRATVTYTDRHGPNKSAASDPTAVVLPANSPPEITITEEATNPSVAENSTEAIYTYEATDPDDDNTITWELGGTNAPLFSIGATTGALTFATGVAPDYEAPNTLDSYEVDVIASDGSLSATLTVMVTVENVEEAGAVALTPSSPQLGRPVTAHLTDPDGRITGAMWTWQHEGDTPGDWIVVWPLGASGASEGAELSSYTPQAADGGRRLRARVVYQDGASTDGNDQKQAASAPSAAVNRPPVASGPQAVSFAEHTLDWVATYAATDPDGDPLSRWSWAGADSAAFLVDVGAGQVAFAAVPDYEQPTDADGNNTYEVAMIASDGVLADTLAVVVTVVNIEEAGAVALSAAAAPRVGQPITATLTDPDGGITGAAWQWQRRAAATDSWQAVPAEAVGTATDYPALSSYTPLATDVGWMLQATVAYRDGHGHGKTAESAATAPVLSNETNAPPMITAGPSTVSVPENTTAVATYTATDPDDAVLDWSVAGTDAAAFAISSAGVLTFVQAPDFETKATYQVEVVAADGGLSARQAVTVTVTNEDDPGAIALSSAQPIVGQPITATLTDPDGSLAKVQWSWLVKSSGAGGQDEEPLASSGASSEATSTYTPDRRVALRVLAQYALRVSAAGGDRAVVGLVVADCRGRQHRPLHSLFG